MTRQVVVEVDDNGRPVNVDGVPTPEVHDARYDYSGVHAWTCPACGYRLVQTLTVIVHVVVTHRCPEPPT